MIRTGYSFKRAFGHLTDVHKRVIECDYPAAVIADTANTFGFVKWSKLCDKAKIKPVFGVELAVVPDLADKKPPRTKASRSMDCLSRLSARSASEWKHLASQK